MPLRVKVIEVTVMPMGDRPRNRPVMPAMLKLNATERTAASTISSLPSGNIRLIRQ